MSSKSDKIIRDLFPVVSIAILGAYISLLFATKRDVSIILITAVIGLISYFTFLDRTFNRHSLWRFLSLPVLYSLMALNGWHFGQKRIWTSNFWYSFLLNILGGIIISAILLRHFSKHPTKKATP